MGSHWLSRLNGWMLDGGGGQVDAATVAHDIGHRILLVVSALL